MSTLLFSKSLHKTITQTSYRLGHSSVRDFYHQLYQEFENKTNFKIKHNSKKSKLSSVISSPYFSYFLEILNNYNRKTTKMGQKQIFTGEKKIVEIEGRRHYLCDGQAYPSVTTIIKNATNNDIQKFIDGAKANLTKEIGLKKAEDRYALPQKVGNFTHDCIELYLNNPKENAWLLERTMLRYLKPVLEEFKEVLAIEYPVWSDKFEYAGALDCVAKMKDGSILLLDWKTSSKAKTLSAVKKAYYLQAAAYCLAFYERTGIKVDGFQICVMYRQEVGKRNPRRSDNFKETEVRPYLDSFLELNQQYQNKFLVYEPF